MRPPLSKAPFIRVGVIAFVFEACDGTAPPPPVMAADAGHTPRCAADHLAPLLGASGVPGCTAVGANDAPTTGEWPDAEGAEAPVVYVGPGAGPGAGTRAAPLHDLGEALAMNPPPATVLLARGAYDLRATLRVGRAVTIRGTGAGEGATVIDGPPGAPAFEVGMEGGAALSVTLARLRVRARSSGSAEVDRATAGLAAAGVATTLTLRDVALERFGDGVRADGATVCAQGITVRRSLRAGLVFTGRSVAVVRDFLIRDGENIGVLADGSVVAMRTGMVADNARDGVVLRGVRTAEPCPASSDGAGCAAATACGDVAVEHRCAANIQVPASTGVLEIPAVWRCRGVSTFEEVAVVGNHVTGMRAERLPPPATDDPPARELALSQPGPVVTATRVVLADTGVVAGEVGGGDGLYVGASARVSLDPTITSEDASGSLVTGNARTGVLVDGDRASPGLSDRLRTYGTLRASGTMVRTNAGPGMYVQEEAVVERLAYGRFVGNAALGLGVTSRGRVQSIQCEHFTETRMGTITTESYGPVDIGDGLSMSEGTGGAGDTRIEDSHFERNARYGLLLSGFNATFVGVNTAPDNVAGVSIFGSVVAGDVTPLGAPATTPPAAVARGRQTTEPLTR